MENTNMQLTESIDKFLPAEIARCQKLLAVFQRTGRHFFGVAILRAALKDATSALVNKDIVGMGDAYRMLKRIK